MLSLCQVVVVVLATLATYLFSWEDAPYNVKVLGFIPSGLPLPAIPSFPNVSYRPAYTGNRLDYPMLPTGLYPLSS